MEEISFSAYMKSNQNPEDLIEKIKENTSSQGFKKDEKLFNYKLDSSSKCVASLRFLPVKVKGKLPIIHRCRHNFQNKDTGRWYIDYCPTTLKENKDCPVCQDNNRFYDPNGETVKRLGVEAAKATGSKRARKKEYVSCIYVIQDSTNPNNNGKVFVWIYGTRVYEKIMAAMKPTEDEIKIQGKKPLPVFDLINGGNFILNLYKHEGQVTYDKCSFTEATPFLGGDEKKIKEVWDQIISLDEYTDIANCTKTFDQLQKRLDFVNGVTASYNKDENKPQQESNQKQEPQEQEPQEQEPSSQETVVDDEEFNKYFNK